MYIFCGQMNGLPQNVTCNDPYCCTYIPEIFPTALCTIQLEYDNARRDHLEIEIGESAMTEIFIVYYDGSEAYENIPIRPDSINERVGAFYG